MGGLVSWLLVGVGAIARKRIALAIQMSTRSRLVAVCGRDFERTSAFAQGFGVERSFCNFSDALQNSNADAVYIATPVDLHVSMAIDALKAGKHVLVEKPLGRTAKECLPLIELARTTNRVSGCAYYRRCSARFRHMRAMLDSDDLGAVLSTRMIYTSWYNPTRDSADQWRVEIARSGGGPLADMGSHMFDIVIGLFGMPCSVFASVERRLQPYDVEDSAAVMVRFDNGALGTANFHWNSHCWKHELELIGSKKSVKWSPFDSGPVVESAGSETRALDLPPANNVHSPLIEDFETAICAECPPISPLAEAVKTNLLLDAIYQSGESRQEVRL